MSMAALLESFTVSLPARGVSKLLREAVRQHDQKALDHGFRSHLRTAHKQLRKLWSGDALFFLWSVDSVYLSGRERELAISIEEACDRSSSGADRRLRQVRSSVRGKGGRNQRQVAPELVAEVLRNWLVEALSPLGAWEILAVGELLIRFGSQLDAPLRTSCLALLLEHHEYAAAGQPTAQTSASAQVPQQPARYQFVEPLLVIEAELLLNLLVQPFINDEIERCEALSIMTQNLMECTDDEGVVQGSVLSVLPHLMAPWTRTFIWNRVFQQTAISDPAAARFKSLTEKCAMVLMPSKQMAVPPESAASLQEPGVCPPNVWAMTSVGSRLCEFRGRGKVRTLLTEIGAAEAPGRTRRQLMRRMRSGHPVDAPRKGVQAWQSDGSAVALMRSSVELLADVCSAEWSRSAVELCLAPFGVPVIAGSWNTGIEIGGRPVSEAGTWECTCWFVDEGVAFAEIEQRCELFTHVRHLLLSTTERFAILTDSVRAGAPNVALQVKSSLQLNPSGTASADEVTREISLAVEDVGVRTFPLWLPDDRIDGSAGSLSCENNALQFSAHSLGAATMPLILDWHPFRRQQPADWTRLTVAESRRIVSDAEATGYRLRIGKHQLLAYLSMVKPQLSRTVLGVHTPDESFYGRIEASGDLDPFVQVEARADES